MREWWRGGVIYQVYPRSFQDSNSDGIGDLPGIVRRLPHIAALGVDARLAALAALPEREQTKGGRRR